MPKHVYCIFRCGKEPTLIGIFRKEKKAAEVRDALQEIKKEQKFFIEQWPINVVSAYNLLLEEEKKWIAE